MFGPPSSFRNQYEYTDKTDHIKIRKLEDDITNQYYKMMLRYENITSPILSKPNPDDIDRQRKFFDRCEKHYNGVSQSYKDVESQYKSFSKSSDIITKNGEAIANALVLFIVKKPKKALALLQTPNIREFLFTGIDDKEHDEIWNMYHVIQYLLRYNIRFIPHWIVDMTKEWLKSKGKCQKYCRLGELFAEKGLTLVVD